MESRAGTLSREGLLFGLGAGLVFGAAEMVVAAAAGRSPLLPVQMAASLAAGRQTLTSTSGAVLTAGVTTHFILAALYGSLYVLLVGWSSLRTTRSYAREGAMGAAFGLALWFINFELIARAGMPWFLEPSQVLQAVLHAGFFGLPLGLAMAAGEQREQRVEGLFEQPA